MDPRKQFLLDTAETARATWLALGLEIFAKEMHLETSNTVYRFLDGICYTVTKKGMFTRKRGDAAGLRLIGWLVEEESGALALSLHPHRGAAAVLWRPQSEGEAAFVLTSATLTLAKSHRDERGEAAAARAAQARRRPDPQSVARLFVAMVSESPRLAS
jgi:hypothetical protein